MKLENIISSEVSQIQKAVFSHTWNVDLIQIQKYYEKQVTVRGSHIQKRKGKRRKL
jgi:hypothetical protein